MSGHWSSALGFWLLVLLIFSGSEGTASESTNAIATGDTIRFTARSLGLRNQIGIVADQVGDSMTVRVQENEEVLLLSRTLVQRLQVCRGSRKPVGECIAFYGLLGATYGALAGLKVLPRVEPVFSFEHDKYTSAKKNALIGAVIGGVLFGLPIGLSQSRPNWITVKPWPQHEQAKRSFGLKLTAHF